MKNKKQPKKPTRKAIPKKTRFEVFKRDKFTCQYCGKKSPDVVLHIDHINPVAKGGDNSITNLVTSCVDCNLGKGPRELSDDTVVEKQRNELERQQERINQIKLMSDWQISLLNTGKAEVDSCNEIIEIITGSRLSDAGMVKIGKIIKKHGLSMTIESIRAAFDRYYDGSDESWERSYSMISKIANIKCQPKWKQDAIKYSNFAKMKGYDRSDTALFGDIIEHQSAVVDAIDFGDLFCDEMDLRQYCEAIMESAGLKYSEGE